MTTEQLPTAELCVLLLDDLTPHPDNPRIAVREDVVEQITAEVLRRGYGPQYAIEVRPYEGGHQIVAGHHRVEAARRAGLSEIPAWVEAMGDDEAFMRLVTSNAQGELAPLEIGVHALHAVPLGKGGRGVTGGLSAYAERIGRDRSGVSQLRAAAEVYLETRETSHGFIADRYSHLYEISRAPREQWADLVGGLIGHGWTVAQTRTRVDTLLDTARERLAEEERLKVEEAEAEAFIADNAPELAAQVGGGGPFETFAEARDVWNRRNREEADRLRREAEEKARLEAEEHDALVKLYTPIARALDTLGGYGGHKDIPFLMAECTSDTLDPPQYARVFELPNLHNAQRFVAALIQLKEAGP